MNIEERIIHIAESLIKFNDGGNRKISVAIDTTRAEMEDFAEQTGNQHMIDQIRTIESPMLVTHFLGISFAITLKQFDPNLN